MIIPLTSGYSLHKKLLVCFQQIPFIVCNIEKTLIPRQVFPNILPGQTINWLQMRRTFSFYTTLVYLDFSGQ